MDNIFLADTRVYFAGVLLPAIRVSITSTSRSRPTATVVMPPDSRLFDVGRYDRIPVHIFQRESYGLGKEFILLFEGFITSRMYLNIASQRSITFNCAGVMAFLDHVRIDTQSRVDDIYKATVNGNNEAALQNVQMTGYPLMFLNVGLGAHEDGETPERISYPYQYLENVFRYVSREPVEKTPVPEAVVPEAEPTEDPSASATPPPPPEPTAKFIVTQEMVDAYKKYLEASDAYEKFKQRGDTSAQGQAVKAAVRAEVQAGRDCNELGDRKRDPNLTPEQKAQYQAAYDEAKKVWRAREAERKQLERAQNTSDYGKAKTALSDAKDASRSYFLKFNLPQSARMSDMAYEGAVSSAVKKGGSFPTFAEAAAKQKAESASVVKKDLEKAPEAQSAKKEPTKTTAQPESSAQKEAAATQIDESRSTALVYLKKAEYDKRKAELEAQLAEAERTHEATSAKLAEEKTAYEAEVAAVVNELSGAVRNAQYTLEAATEAREEAEAAFRADGEASAAEGRLPDEELFKDLLQCEAAEDAAEAALASAKSSLEAAKQDVAGLANPERVKEAEAAVAEIKKTIASLEKSLAEGQDTEAQSLLTVARQNLTEAEDALAAAKSTPVSKAELDAAENAEQLDAAHEAAIRDELASLRVAVDTPPNTVPETPAVQAEHSSVVAEFNARQAKYYNLMHRFPRVPYLDEPTHRDAKVKMWCAVPSQKEEYSGGHVFPILRGMQGRGYYDFMSKSLSEQQTVMLTASDIITAAVDPMDCDYACFASPAFHMGTQKKTDPGYEREHRLNAACVKLTLIDSIPPMCNVMFRSQVLQIESRDSFDSCVTRVKVVDTASFGASHLYRANTSETLKDAYTAEQYPRPDTKKEGYELPDARLNALGSYVLETEKFTGPIIVEVGTPAWWGWVSGILFDAPLAGITQEEVAAKLLEVRNIKQHMLNRQYLLTKYGAFTISVSTTFNPYIVPGFPGVVFDSQDTGLSFAGYVNTVSHEILPGGGMTTNVEMSFVRRLEEAAAVDIEYPEPEVNALLHDEEHMTRMYSELFGFLESDPVKPLNGQVAKTYAEVLRLFGGDAYAAKDPQNNALAAYAMQRRNICTFDQYLSFMRLKSTTASGPGGEKIPMFFAAKTEEEIKRYTPEELEEDYIAHRYGVNLYAVKGTKAYDEAVAAEEEKKKAEEAAKKAEESKKAEAEKNASENADATPKTADAASAQKSRAEAAVAAGSGEPGLLDKLKGAASGLFAGAKSLGATAFDSAKSTVTGPLNDVLENGGKLLDVGKSAAGKVGSAGSSAGKALLPADTKKTAGPSKKPLSEMTPADLAQEKANLDAEREKAQTAADAAAYDANTAKQAAADAVNASEAEASEKEKTDAAKKQNAARDDIFTTRLDVREILKAVARDAFERQIYS